MWTETRYLVMKRLAAVCSLSLIVAGCRHAPPAPQPEPAPDVPIPLVVHNNNLLDVVFYAERSGASFRLGVVSSCSTDTLQIAPGFTYLGAVRLSIDPIGSRETFPLGPIVVFPGERIEVTVENYLPATSWRVLSRGIAVVPEVTRR